MKRSYTETITIKKRTEITLNIKFNGDSLNKNRIRCYRRHLLWKRDAPGIMNIVPTEGMFLPIRISHILDWEKIIKLIHW